MPRQPIAPRAVTEPAEDLSRLVAGEKAEWDRFVQRYSRVIYAAVQRRLVPAGRGHEVDDVAQDVFVKLCGREFHLLRSYDPGRAKLSTWLTVIATSTSIDHLRRQTAPTAALDAVPEAVMAVDPKPFERIKIPPDLLSPRQEVAEAAEMLGVDPQTVRSTHHKAMIKLRAHFKEESG
jgi:RNA polymerase sigma-70 factor (ECF subfamily)